MTVAAEISAAIRHQLAHGHYAPSNLYGDGYVSERIAEALCRLTPYVQKRLNYIYRDKAPLAARPSQDFKWSDDLASRWVLHSSD